MLFVLLLAIILPASLLAQHHPVTGAREFINAVAGDSSTLNNFFLEDEILLSRRLGITYEDIKNKFLIGYDIDPQMKKGMREGKRYDIRTDTLDEEFTRVTVAAARQEFQRQYYFSRGKAVSPIRYATRGWHHIESRHFTFIVSDTTQFNQYAVGRLERFVDSISVLLRYSKKEQEALRENKIVYILCRDEHEIEQVSGFRTLGVYVVAYDCIVSTFNCHYHELLHLLINYKLKHLPLYTHPLLQEGFAVAFGGRGGKEPRVILDAGHFLLRSGMISINTLLSRAAFLQEDASISYPASGLYNKFLLSELGLERYLQLYRKYSRGEDAIDTISIDPADLPPEKAWQAFLENYRPHADITPGVSSAVTDTGKTIVETESSYVFRIGNTLVLTTTGIGGSYRSKRFGELMRGQTYHGEKYLITATAEEINVYNLFSNNLIASLVDGFCLPPVQVPEQNGRFVFEVKKRVFDEPLR